MADLNFSSKLTYKPVGLTGNVQIPFDVSSKYNACNIGTLDVPADIVGEAMPLEPIGIEVPFGSVNSAIGFYLKNTCGQDLYVFINEVFSHSIADQGTILITMPQQPVPVIKGKYEPAELVTFGEVRPLPDKVKTGLLSSVTLYKTTLQKKVGTVDYMVFGE